MNAKSKSINKDKEEDVCGEKEECPSEIDVENGNNILNPAKKFAMFFMSYHRFIYSVLLIQKSLSIHTRGK